MAKKIEINPGDTVNYIFAENTGPLAGKIVKAKVKHVHEGHDGRLLNVEVETATETLKLGPTPYRDAEEEAGNTWHLPEEEKPPVKPNAKADAKPKDDKK